MISRSKIARNLRRLAGALSVFAFLSLSLSVLTPQQAAAWNYPDPECLSNAGNVNLVIFVKVIDPANNTEHYADHFKFKIKSYNSNPGTSEGNAFDAWQHNSILYRNQGSATPKGDNTNTLEVKRSGASMVAGKGNLCRPGSSGAKEASYAFRDGDGTSLSCFPNSAGNTRTGCAYNANFREDNNGSWILSCLASNATAYQISMVDVYGERDGNFIEGTDIGGSNTANLTWVNGSTIKLFSAPGQELNTKERRVIFKYRLDDPPAPKVVNVTPNLTAGPDVEIGDNATFTQSATVDDFPTVSQWGWNNKAVQNADHEPIDAHKVDYDSQQGAEDGYATVRLRCGDDSYQADCSGHGKNVGTAKNPDWRRYHCDGGAYKDDCGTNYAWSCTDTGYGPDVTRSGINGDTTPGSCKLYRYYCKDTNGNYYSGGNYRYRGFSGRTNDMCYASDTGAYNSHKWVCNAPSQEGPAYGGDDANFDCKIYSCKHPDDPQNFYVAAGNGEGQADNRCDYRCSGGDGNHAPLSSGVKNGDGDLRCYIRPVFTIYCQFTEPGSVSTAVQNVTGNGTYCTGPGSTTTKAGTSFGLLCQTTKPYVGPFTGTPPGKGKGSDPDQYRATWIVDVSPDTDRACTRVVAKPVFKVSGGDVAAGGTFAAGGICSTAIGSISSWSGMATGYNAAGTTLGAFASGNINGFATAVGGSGATNPPGGLAFANTSPSGEIFGGGFGTMPCISDHYGSMPTGTPTAANLTTTLTTPATGSYRMSGNQVLGTGAGITVPLRTHATIYIDGNLRISGTGGVKYMRAGWTSIDDIPAVKFVVRGNIYIDRGISELNGIFVAQPNGAAGGHIYTCVDPTTGNPYADEDRFNNCTTSVSPPLAGSPTLTVNGVFIAKRIHFDRTTGTQRQGTTAEQFNYLPELWLSQWPADKSGSSTKYDALISLPPTL